MNVTAKDYARAILRFREGEVDEGAVDGLACLIDVYAHGIARNLSEARERAEDDERRFYGESATETAKADVTDEYRRGYHDGLKAGKERANEVPMTADERAGGK
jgi:hypothetical protein